MCTFHFSKIYTRCFFRHNHKERDITIKNWTTLDNATKQETTRQSEKKRTNEKEQDKTEQCKLEQAKMRKNVTTR